MAFAKVRRVAVLVLLVAGLKGWVQAEPGPFRIPGPGDSPKADGPVRPWPHHGRLDARARVVASYGLPVRVSWDTPPGAQVERLSYREGDTLRWLDVSGRGSVVLRFQGRVSGCVVEALRPAPGPEAGYESHLRCLEIGVRGLLPFLGDPSAGPGLADGVGGAVRCQRPAGLIQLGGNEGPARLVLADAGAHVLRRVSPWAEVAGGWGQDGTPGYQDGRAEEARFDTPTHLALDRRVGMNSPWAEDQAFLVADSGNQVIRRVDPGGRVTTLAGTPGQPGHEDGPAAQARFRDPRGLVMDSAGWVFIADRGNQVIRRIDPAGVVSTLAGKPGVAGGQDGWGEQARFSALAGLVEGPGGALYVVDGHALRRVGKDGLVTTVLGHPERPGFLDAWEPGRTDLAWLPCLRDPAGLCASGDRIYLADAGNHSVRVFEPNQGSLRTLAGDPLDPGIRFGLLRDGQKPALDLSRGALEAPRDLLVMADGDVLVSTGPCVVRVSPQGLLGPPPGLEPAAVGDHAR